MDNKDKARARKLLATIVNAATELLAMFENETEGDDASQFDHLDGSRRRRPEWKRRGRVFYAIAQEDGRVSTLRFFQILLDARYKDGRGANGFFRGDPIPVLERDGNDVVLTERGWHAARFYEQYWLPQEDEDA